MRNFDEAHYLAMGEAVMKQAGACEEIGRKATQKPVENIVISAIGGTWARFYAVAHVLRKYTSLPVYLENSAAMCVNPPRYLNDKSVVITASNSGNTQEILDSLKVCRDRGATILSVGEPETCPLREASDYYICAPLTYGENMYLAFSMISLSVLYALGDFPAFHAWVAEMKRLHKALIPLKEKFDPVAAEMARKLYKAPYLVMASSGVLEMISYWYCLCVLEECQWIRANSVSSADFFHGTLELMEDGLPLLLVKGIDEYRPLDERVEAFAKKTTDSLMVLDIKEYLPENLDPQFELMYSVFVAASLLSDRLEVHLELNSGHSLGFRRYYRRLAY